MNEKIENALQVLRAVCNEQKELTGRCSGCELEEFCSLIGTGTLRRYIPEKKLDK